MRAGETVRIPLAKATYEWRWVVRVGYLSSGESQASLRMGKDPAWFQVHRNLNQVIFLMEGVGDTVEMTVQDPGVTLCTNDITVGVAVPQQ
jgi:hypothetical protein